MLHLLCVWWSPLACWVGKLLFDFCHTRWSWRRGRWSRSDEAIDHLKTISVSCTKTTQRQQRVHRSDFFFFSFNHVLLRFCRLSPPQILNAIMNTLKEVHCFHRRKQVSEVLSHMCRNISTSRKTAEPKQLFCVVVSRQQPGNILPHLYAIGLWEPPQELWPGFLLESTPVMKCCHTGYMWGKGLPNCPDPLHIHTVCLRTYARLRGCVERCQRVGFLNPIVPFHCVGVFVWGEQAPHDIFPTWSPTCYFKAGSWCLVNTKQ